MLIALLVFSFTLWFGLYLIARDPGKPGLRFAGLGLVSYALALGLGLLVPYAPALEAWRTLPILMIALFWVAATLYLIPGAAPAHLGANGIIGIAVIALLLLFTAVALGVTQAVIGLIPLALAVYAVVRVRQAFRSGLPRRPLTALVTATMFFALSLGLLILPLDFLSEDTVLLAVSFDLLLLGYAIGGLDAYEEGTNLLPDALRSLAAAALAAVVFGGQVALVIGGDFTFARLILLLTVITTAIILETFSDTVQSVLDRLIFSARVQRERSVLRAVNDALPNADERFDLSALDDAEFVRLTRRAFSHFGDLNKLAASPLTRLPIITERLNQRGKADNLLERTAELKALLAESVARLKPNEDQAFGITDEWRYYNVLYFPYIAGLKPYSRRALHDDLDREAQQALDWFQTYVPERTLHNWQNAAAKLIAQHLHELQSISA